MFCDIVDDYFLQQMVLEPTRRENILDLILTNTPEVLMNINICEGNSDHSSIEFDWKIKLGRLKQTPRFVWNFRTAD